MKWYSHRLYKAHLADIAVDGDYALEMYYPWVIQIANTFPRHQVACGILNLQDLVQAGYVGLLEAWNVLDHSKGQAERWTFIKKRIRWSIRREIDKHGSFIAKPINKLEEDRNKLRSADKILVNIFPKFFDLEIMDFDDDSPWESVRLLEIIDEYLYSTYSNVDHIDILRASYGIDRDKPASLKELAAQYHTSVNYINQIKQRLLNKIREDEDFTKLINNFYHD